MPRDEHDVAARLGDAGRHRADAYLRDQLDMDPRAWIRILQIMDELLDVLDRIDIVVRRWADQADTWCRVPRPRDPRVHLVPGQLTALARFGALGHLDLQVVSIDQVFGGDAETT